MALVTGAAGGIGEATARVLAENGADMTVTDTVEATREEFGQPDVLANVTGTFPTHMPDNDYCSLFLATADPDAGNRREIVTTITMRRRRSRTESR